MKLKKSAKTHKSEKRKILMDVLSQKINTKVIFKIFDFL